MLSFILSFYYPDYLSFDAGRLLQMHMRTRGNFLNTVGLKLFKLIWDEYIFLKNEYIYTIWILPNDYNVKVLD